MPYEEIYLQRMIEDEHEKEKLNPDKILSED